MTNASKETDAKLNLYIKFLKERLFFEPSSETLHYNLGLAYTHKGLIDEAISEFKQSLECNPNLAQAYVNLGGLYMTAEADPAKSIEANLKALELDPDLGPAHSNLAFSYLRGGQPEKAILHGQKALELIPGSPQAYQLLATALSAGRPGRSLSRAFDENDRGGRLRLQPRISTLLPLFEHWAKTGRPMNMPKEPKNWATKPHKPF